jgi:CheY-like chemotaxis protein
MATVLALVADLLFASRIQGALTTAGHEVELIADERRLRERLAAATGPAEAVLVVDLTDPQLDGVGVLAKLAGDGKLEHIRTLGFYAHVQASQRERAQAAGFDLVVPRSRMAREGAQLIERLAATR